MPAFPPAYLSVCSWIKEYSVFPYCCLQPPFPSPSCLTFYCELLGDWQKRSAVQPFYTLSSLLPSSIHLSIHSSIPSSLFTSVSQTLLPLVSVVSVRLCFSPTLHISNMLSLSTSIHGSESSLPYNVGGGVWVIGCTHTHTHTHTPFIHSFSLCLLSHSHTARRRPWDGCALDPLCPAKHLISPVFPTGCDCLWTCNNNLNWVHTTKNWIDQPSQLSGRQRLYTNTSTSYSADWLIPICLLSVLHLCCRSWMGGICHIVIFLLLTSQFIRWLLGPWWTRVFSLPSLSFCSSPSLSDNSKKTFNRERGGKKRKKKTLS